MAQALSCWPLTAEAQVRFRVNPSEVTFVVNKEASERGFFFSNEFGLTL